ncbi:hypothetical protein NPIL_68451 [Nephila pilipes]|uniref:Integrase catalytic domain-containing protein n=1 Tax=Nephila pilipes TaxID=299642 RepID=A0A8X6JQI4_NEPPI|nr:hypothetical protein NPIL_68451 [Nephila pilipes]
MHIVLVCLYARYTVDNSTEVNLICSRNKLVPVKKITLLRFELLTAQLGARLFQYFCRETNMHSYTVYTDNATTFHATNKELVLLLQTLGSAKIQQYYARIGTTWKFTALRTAWWRRLIGIIKQCL